ncbi:hydrogenase formation protein HypD [Streptomyces sp. NPDC049577]|uniref:hydrogenase formation protein HypD n=1 Tax=Streptomyces sp. NPDC049577 TaxID=3155153 RepID=UPI0034288A74
MKIAESLRDRWELIKVGDPRTLEGAKRALVQRFGDVLRAVAGAREGDPARGRTAAYGPFFEIAVTEPSYPVRLAIAQEMGAGGDAAFEALREKFPLPSRHERPDKDDPWVQYEEAFRHEREEEHRWREECLRKHPDYDKARDAYLDFEKTGARTRGRIWRQFVMRAWLVPMMVGSVGEKHRAQARERLQIWLGHLEPEQSGSHRADLPLYLAHRLGVRNFSMLVSHVRVPPAIEAIMRSPGCRVQAFLAAGHVCSVMGLGEYPELARRFKVPVVVTGFEPLDILEGVRRTVRQLESGEHRVDNAYPRAVRDEGNPAARQMLAEVFEITDRAWRGIGTIPGSGWRLAPAWRAYDAEHRFRVTDVTTEEPAACRSGEVLQGLIKPHECAAFGTTCTPRTPLGATMVSSEGACAAYYLYRRLAHRTDRPEEATPVG